MSAIRTKDRLMDMSIRYVSVSLGGNHKKMNLKVSACDESYVLDNKWFVRKGMLVTYDGFKYRKLAPEIMFRATGVRQFQTVKHLNGDTFDFTRSNLTCQSKDNVRHHQQIQEEKKFIQSFPSETPLSPPSLTLPFSSPTVACSLTSPTSPESSPESPPTVTMAPSPEFFFDLDSHDPLPKVSIMYKYNKS